MLLACSDRTARLLHVHRADAAVIVATPESASASSLNALGPSRHLKRGSTAAFSDSGTSVGTASTATKESREQRALAVQHGPPITREWVSQQHRLRNMIVGARDGIHTICKLCM